MPPRKRPSKISKSNVGNIQTVVVKVGETKRKRRAKRARGAKRPSDSDYQIPMRPLPPVVYQMTNVSPPVGGAFDYTPALFRAPPVSMGLSEKTPMKAMNPILEDIGQVGTEGRVEILSLPSRRETLSELITPVSAAEKPTDVFDFGMENVYDDPDSMSMISSITNPTFSRRPKKAVSAPDIGVQSSLFKYFEPKESPFQTAKAPGSILGGISGQTTAESINTPPPDVSSVSSMFAEANKNPLLNLGPTRVIKVKKGKKPMATIPEAGVFA